MITRGADRSWRLAAQTRCHANPLLEHQPRREQPVTKPLPALQGRPL